MASFTTQPDEGYSEDPLTAVSSTLAVSFSSKQPREGAVAAIASVRLGDELPEWLTQHISTLSVSSKTDLVMALLNGLPTTVISQIVEQLNPRLYIDFVRRLPPEICLTILGYLDPISLINVARACHAWYGLAVDHKLWQQLYYMEGFRANVAQILAQEIRLNESQPNQTLRRVPSDDVGHMQKKRAIARSPVLDADMDMEMPDATRPGHPEPAGAGEGETSVFGGPRLAPRKTGQSQRGIFSESRDGEPRQRSTESSTDKGKGRAISPEPMTEQGDQSFLPSIPPASRIAPATLWVWDPRSKRHRMNWRYLYTMRRRLESNWELGKFTNFQFPRPDHPLEGHRECIYSLQYNSQYLVSGSRDRTLKIWDMETRRCLRTLARHRGSVLCLQFDSDPDEDIIVSGSSDSDVIIWQFSTGKVLRILKNAHRESVLNVKFDKRILVTCSKDKTIKVFNRRPLRYGDLGYQEVDPVGMQVNYSYALNMTPEDFPEMPAWTMIGTLEGHSAAVNAVQIHEREVVSASGDRHIKVWDWPTQACMRTIVGHTKGIACVQYDGRRIVSGSSDNEVKVFDRQTGLEVASLRSHSNLVRTVQAGFGDLPDSVEHDAAEAKEVDALYFKALEAGLLEEPDRRAGRRHGNPGSRRPEDICAYGAKLPPGGGGGKYGRIVSGSYDTSIIIWRRDKEGIWKDQHHLKQEEAALAARHARPVANTLAHSTGASDSVTGIPLHPSVRGIVSRHAASSTGAPSPPPQSASAPPGTSNGPSQPPLSAAVGHAATTDGSSTTLAPTAIQHYHRIIDTAVNEGQAAFLRAIAAYPAILTQRDHVEEAIDRQHNPVTRSHLRQAFSGALIRAQFDQALQRREALRNQEAGAGAGAGGLGGPATEEAGNRLLPPGSAQLLQTTAAHIAATSAMNQQVPAHFTPITGAHLHQVPPPVPSLAPDPTSHAPAAAAPTPAQHQNQPAHHHPHQHHNQQHHPHVAQAPLEGHDAANPARVFKLQYDARRIICCSQTPVIVGWDFCNGDPQLEEASQFFAPVQ